MGYVRSLYTILVRKPEEDHLGDLGEEGKLSLK
jgi:hypothetical protein